jgi:protein N-lysine methyltransferase METTL21A
VLGSDVIYNEEAVDDLLITLNQLSGKHTTILLAGELRNGKASLFASSVSFWTDQTPYKCFAYDCIDAVLECFLEAAMEDFLIACIEQDQWHPEFRSNRVALFILVKKPEKPSAE